MKLTRFVCLFLLTTATLAPMHTVAQANQSQGSPIFSRFQGPPLARTGRIWAAAHRSVSPQAPVLNFAPAVAYDSGGQNPLFVATGDLNGDGKGDLVVANTSSDTVGVLLGNGDGTFQAAVTFPGGNQATALLARDFDGNGKLDLVVANAATYDLTVLLGDGKGGFGAPIGYDLPTRLFVGQPSAGDFDGDGSIDLAVGVSNGVALLRNLGCLK